MAENDLYTQDGTVDYLGNPAKKNETGSRRASLFVLVSKGLESLAFYGVSANLVVYVNERLGQPTSTASNNVTNWLGTCFVTPLLGGFVSDAYLGRYMTTTIFSTVYCSGMLLLALSASIEGLKPICHPPNGSSSSCRATETQTAVFFAALYLIAVGTGGIKPNVSSFGADQFDDSDETEKKNKRSSYFSWLFFSANAGAIVAESVLVWIQTSVNWEWGFGVPALALGISVASFFAGTRLYRHRKPGGSPVTRLGQVFVAALRKFKVEVPVDVKLLHETSSSVRRGSTKLEHTNHFPFLDRAAVETTSDTSLNPWRLCTVTQVEESKCFIRLLPVWITVITFATVCAQCNTLFVLQGLKMDARVGHSGFQVPSASLTIFNALGVLVFIPVYDKLVVPMVKKFTHLDTGLTQLQRIGIGLFISIVGMLYAGFLEFIRLEYNGRGNDEDPISIFWQVPQYFVIGIAEALTVVGLVELLYDQSPESMRSLCSALLPLTLGLGNYLSTASVSIANRVTSRGGRTGWIPNDLDYGHLDYFFYVLAGLSVSNLVGFVLVAKWYTYKKVVWFRVENEDNIMIGSV
ncbi:hypothetical protein M569_15359 [Genlisea aurea]|uniref:Peptide transporter n=1 Tax=Genlisea aurea TaxID=192259 RepID=S8C4W6_9LAMI|nr:hypothetical protein M569_15359 [Genlisea aurea]